MDDTPSALARLPAALGAATVVAALALSGWVFAAVRPSSPLRVGAILAVVVALALAVAWGAARDRPAVAWAAAFALTLSGFVGVAIGPQLLVVALVGLFAAGATTVVGSNVAKNQQPATP